MKSLKITLILVAVFCLTIAGTSTQKETEPAASTIQQVDKAEFEYVASVVKKTKRPSHEL
jgi:outer membrane lipoprotein-sorting protein